MDDCWGFISVERNIGSNYPIDGGAPYSENSKRELIRGESERLEEGSTS